jgi:feruloyl esterase
MPLEEWNGKFVGVGNGVWAGAISYFAMVEPLLRGYATAATDDGHQGDPLDAGFAAGHPQKLIDFGYRAPHLMTVDAKATITAFYNKPAAHSLFVSCSTGGRQGLMEAYRYPHDYDGISATAPANPMTALMIGSLWTGYAALKSPARTIPPPKFAMIHRAVIAACDAKDGVKDGIVSAPERCAFDPSTLQCPGDDASDCLTAAQIETLRDIYRGPRNTRTGQQIYPGFELGSESQFALLTAGPEPFRVAMSYMRDLVFTNPSWDFRSFDYDRDVQRVVQFGKLVLDVPASGLDAYFTKGGKLLLSHGLADGLIPPKATQQFYAALIARRGLDTADRGVRLFMVPGMGHCGGGDGPSIMDLLGTIDTWVDTGHAPAQINASNPPGAPPRSRPVCPHPQEAVYTGSGSADQAGNFKCQVRPSAPNQ